MLVKSIEQKIKINKAVSISVILASIVIVIAGLFFSYKIVEDSRKSIYILDNGVPILVKQTDETAQWNTNHKWNFFIGCFLPLLLMMNTLSKM